MSSKFTLEQIREFWQSQAQQHGQAPDASWSDVWAINLEIRTITELLQHGEKVLDVGCANGYSTLHYAAARKVEILGIDYIPEMIEQAAQKLDTLLRAGAFPGDARFAQGDIFNLEQYRASFDKLIVTRVLINLGSWENQQKALHSCSVPLRKNGYLLLSEATVQGWERLNALRREWNLPAIPMPPFNEYVDEERLLRAAEELFELVEIKNFASSYYVATRFLKPLLARIASEESAPIDPAQPLMEWNRWCSELPAWGDYGIQKLFVLRKRV